MNSQKKKEENSTNGLIKSAKGKPFGNFSLFCKKKIVVGPQKWYLIFQLFCV